MSPATGDRERKLRDADQRRRDAMIAADAQALGGLLADDLVWTHSSGGRDDKAAFLERIAAATTRYLELTVSDDAVSEHPTLLLHHGTLTGRAVVNGQEKALRNRFLAVWRDDAGRLELMAWQSTGF